MSAIALFFALTAQAAPQQILPIEFKSGKETLKGDLYLPVDYKPGQKRPAVLITGAWFTIKDQMPATYAREFAKRGMIAMTFDFRGFGTSSGSPRNVEDPILKQQDIVAAAKFLSTRPEIAGKQVNGMAMCASSGYMANAILAGAPIKSLALSALWIQDAAAVEMVYGGKAGVANLINTSQTAAQKFAETGQPQEVPAAGPVGSTAIMQQAPYYQDPKRGLIPQWDNKFALQSWEKWLQFDSLAPAAKLKTPTLVMHSDNAALPDLARKFYENLAGPKSIWWSTDAHMDFYDQPEPVSRTVTLAVEHYKKANSPKTDAEQIVEVFHGIANSVDAKAFGATRQLFADDLVVDYSSLGGAVGKIKATDLINGWAQGLSKYRFMRHQYFNFDVQPSGNKAVANFEGIATLHHGEAAAPKMWTVGGTYEAELAKLNGKWLVTGMKFQMKWNHGDR